VWERWPLILGLALVLVVLFLRGGVMEAVTRLRAALSRRPMATELGGGSE
jgi:branched-chain amino acid transport system permease protein